MVYFIAYLVFGVVSVYGFATAHLVMAERSGYDAIKWWMSNKDSLDTSVDGNFFIGLLIWPVRLIEFVFQTVPALYEQYDLKE